MIYSSVVYGHPVKYSYEIPYEFLYENSYENSYEIPNDKILQYFRTVLFKQKILLHTFSEQLVSKYHNSYFFGAALSSEQLLFLRSSFFQNSHFSSALFFSE